ncbi:MAG: type I restriction enzyme HsdR N-terminal domain-containing protein [Bacteroidales bacterium]|nr:type I restriction enzyme HsdR N-terminal domain-containing protein [Bacteroidales bacterium]MBR6416993.1 type I restriction enzyme HsdR N-terminal domain-containing protein [Bacteroidales bacterium]
MEKVFDPIRKKEVPLTPEEKVRQWFIRILLDQAKVPQTMMRVEAGMKFGQEIGSVGGTSRKTYRADILVYDRSLKPLLVVECKREDVPITEEVLLQALRYNSVLGVRFLVLTNGQRTVICSLGKDGATYLQALPSWEEMISSPV